MTLSDAAPAIRPGASRARRFGLGFGAGVVLLILGAAFLFKLQHFMAPDGNGFGDFDLFRLVGKMGLEGRIAGAYDPSVLGAAQKAAGGEVQPWAYPPQFDLVVMGLAGMGRGAGFALFMGVPMLSYVALLWLLSERRLSVPLLLTSPALLITTLGGQNGFLTASLAGLFALLALQGRRIAGLPLGLLAIKPHLGLGLGLYALFRGRWGTALTAAGVVIASSALATALLGADIWGVFIGGLHHTAELLKADGFHLSRMISVYAGLRGAGLPVGLALGAQALSAIAAGVLLGWAVWMKIGARAELGLALLVTLTMSPYGFDYDLTFFGLALALLWPLLAPRITPPEALGLVALALVATGTSLALILVGGGMAQVDRMLRMHEAFVMSGPAILIFAFWAAAILRREQRKGGIA